MAIRSSLRIRLRTVAAAGLVLVLAGCVITGQPGAPPASSALSTGDPLVRGQRLVELCENHYRDGQTAQALAACRRAMELNPTRPTLLGQVGKLLAALGEPRESALVYRRLVAVDPDNAAAWSGLERGFS